MFYPGNHWCGKEDVHHRAKLPWVWIPFFSPLSCKASLFGRLELVQLQFSSSRGIGGNNAANKPSSWVFAQLWPKTWLIHSPGEAKLWHSAHAEGSSRNYDASQGLEPVDFDQEFAEGGLRATVGLPPGTLRAAVTVDTAPVRYFVKHPRASGGTGTWGVASAEEVDFTILEHALMTKGLTRCVFLPSFLYVAIAVDLFLCISS